MPVSVVVALLVATSVVGQLRGPPELVDVAAAASRIPATPSSVEGGRALPEGDGSADLERERVRAVERAVRSVAWPSTTRPALDDAFATRLAPAMRPGGCRNEPAAEHPALCHLGAADGARRALVIGDSIALSWTPAVASALGPDGWSVDAMGFASCPGVDIAATATGAPATIAACARSRDSLQRVVRELRPDLVLIASSQSTVENMLTTTSRVDAIRSWSEATSRTIELLARSTT